MASSLNICLSLSHKFPNWPGAPLSLLTFSAVWTLCLAILQELVFHNLRVEYLFQAAESHCTFEPRNRIDPAKAQDPQRVHIFEFFAFNSPDGSLPWNFFFFCPQNYLIKFWNFQTYFFSSSLPWLIEFWKIWSELKK